jgi:hypothetical protein
MIINSRAVLLVVVAGLMPVAAQAQWYSSAPSQPPLYPYAVQANRPYAVEVAPNTYVIQRPDVSRRRPAAKIRNVPMNGRGKVDPALVEELRNRPKVKRPVIEATQVVREKPVVIETKRYVDDPPRVIERYNIVEDKPVPTKKKNKRVAAIESDDAPAIDKRANKDNVKRVINAEAEITILGPDRMSIRLFRKGDGTKAKASAE